MFTNVKEGFVAELRGIAEAGLLKRERVITGPQGARIRVRASTILSMEQATPEQREELRAFHKALDEERDDPWAD